MLVTGYDILFFWVARMMLFGLYAMDGVQPFDVVALHGMVRDKHGKKMSKSFGNAVDPLDWMDAYGSDALRFTLARGANPGTDVPIGEEWVQGSRNFCNKLWNAARFALLNGATVAAPPPPAAELSTVDRWLLSRLSAVVAEVDADYEDFEFAKAAEALYHFIWDDFCDWYVELAKVPLAAGGEAADRTRRVLGHVLDTRAAAAAPDRAVRDRDAVDGADRRRVGRRRAVAGGRPGAARTRPPRPSSRRCRTWSPRCAGSGPTRACGRRSGWRRGSAGWTRPAWPATSRWCGR